MSSRSICLPIIAVVVGFVNAFAAFQVHSMLFCLLPLWAFGFGYFSSRKTGLLSGFLLFMSYTTAITFMGYPTFEPLEYLFNFLAGGFVLCIIGYGALSVRRGVKTFRSIGVLVVLALLVGWCAFISFPRYTYSYWVTIVSSERQEDIEIYLPMVAVAGEPYSEILDHPFPPARASSGDRFLDRQSLEIVDTEHGKMLKLRIPELERWGPTYTASVSFRMSGAPEERLQFMPKYDVGEIGLNDSERLFGPVRVGAREYLQEFRLPMRVNSDTTASVEILSGCSAGRVAGINFRNHEARYYSEVVDTTTITGDDWVLVGAKAVMNSGVSGVD